MEYMNSRHCIVVAVDMQGHGYSEGERCLMLKHDDMVRDVLQVVRCFENEDRDKELVFEEHESSFKRSDLTTFKKLPFFLMGSSMGGAVSTLSGQAMHSQSDTYPNFKGAILLAPALSFKMPNWLLVETLRYTVGTCTPDAQMPEFLSNVNDNSLTFKHPESLAYSEADTWGNPGALGWNLGMRWGTALMFIDLAAALRETLSQVAYPFMILHDPGDQVCSIDGSRNLLAQSRTAEDKKKLIEVPGYLHGVLANETEACCDYALEWMDTMIV
eukprot:Colp12_sorted_trinity150504_noHs@21786